MDGGSLSPCLSPRLFPCTLSRSMFECVCLARPQHIKGCCFLLPSFCFASLVPCLFCLFLYGGWENYRGSVLVKIFRHSYPELSNVAWISPPNLTTLFARPFPTLILNIEFERVYHINSKMHFSRHPYGLAHVSRILLGHWVLLRVPCALF